MTTTKKMMMMMMMMKSLSIYYLCVWFKRFCTSACNECLQLTWELVLGTNCLKGSVDCQGNRDVQEGWVVVCTWRYSCKASKMLLQSKKCATPDCEYVTNEKSNVLLQIHTSLTMYGIVLNWKNFKVDFSYTECHLERLQLMWNQGPTDPSPTGKACFHKPAWQNLLSSVPLELQIGKLALL
jgi:hypothetical protein